MKDSLQKHNGCHVAQFTPPNMPAGSVAALMAHRARQLAAAFRPAASKAVGGHHVEEMHK